ncbi:branched-chain amino acid ABC transporter permease [Jatrophihabitans cynanchi]|uniref:Branched-chain amino acid ABC transporter permease n=1 Tax=Jatrophihabitans cynanchi TaxID=2944128 RepID=A0ABY7K3B5_9ACTN|nr:branched-chain amino acid ABC transporter permease [Jatrophihabitans sp. SB3-54]WAX58393.1 branched-chain amino acid ABC transporter permease [Jatrophihabitans sp. SB3-54]
MDQVIVSIIGGASLGGTYALIGLGLVLAFRATATFNFAHGQLMLLPAFIVAKWQTERAAPLGISIAFSLLVVAAVSILFYLLVLQKLTGLPHFMGVIATLGLAAVLDGAMALQFGSTQYTINIPFLPTGPVTVLGTRVSSTSLVLAGFTLVLAIAVATVLRTTRFGTQVRAAGQDAVLASQGGINVRRLYIVSWAMAGVLAGVAGLSYGATNVVSPSVVNLALLAFPAILLGGLDSIEGAVVGGIIVGIMQGFVATYWGGELTDVMTYLLLLAVLLVRPTGLFGTAEVTRV